MSHFVVNNPSMASWIIGGLFSLIGFLVAGILFFVKRTIDNLTAAILKLEASIKEGQVNIGDLKDRMQKQETTCEMQRKSCPNKHGLEVSWSEPI